MPKYLFRIKSIRAAQAKHAQEQAARLRAQEAQLAAMKRQLEAMQAVSAGRAPRRDRDGRAPVEYICPITQVHPVSWTAASQALA